MLMLRYLLLSVLMLALLFTSVSCFKRVAPSNNREPYYGRQYGFWVNNNNVSKAIIYKRYIQNKKH